MENPSLFTYIIHFVVPPLLVFSVCLLRVRNEFLIKDKTGIVGFGFNTIHFFGYVMFFGLVACLFYYVALGVVTLPEDIGQASGNENVALQSPESNTGEDTSSVVGLSEITIWSKLLTALVMGLSAYSIVGINFYSVSVQGNAFPLSFNSLFDLVTGDLTKGIKNGAYKRFDKFIDFELGRINGMPLDNIRKHFYDELARWVKINQEENPDRVKKATITMADIMENDDLKRILQQVYLVVRTKIFKRWLKNLQNQQQVSMN